MFLRRPNKNETEDDLLEQQKNFLKQSNKYPENENIAIEKSNKNFKDNHDIIDLQFKIVERDNLMQSDFKKQNNLKNDCGFPQAPNLQIDLGKYPTLDKSQRGMSLYAQRLLKNKNESKTTINNNKTSEDIVSGIGLGTENWRKDITEIKNQNKKLIENMSRKEIEELREEIMKKLNSKTVEFLKSKKFQYRSEVEEKMNYKQQIENFPEKNENIEEKIPIKMEEIESNKYVHMNTVEKEKLSWIGDINDTLSKYLQEKNIAARFNFEGELIDLETATKIDVHQGLHHHGEEPERPGYTINELFIYLQSSFPSQKQIGLKVFEKIIIKAYSGYYDSCFNTNLIEYLLKDSPLVLAVRICLDETSDTVWKCAINTLKALLCNTIFDEIFLDRGYLIFEDYLSYGYQIDLTLKPVLDQDIDIDDEMSDQQYLMYDSVDCLLNRTSILQRFAYLIKNQLYDYDQIFIENIFDILIRFARHSKESSEKIIKSVNLMDAILVKIKNKNTPLEKMNIIDVKIFKLLRVCIGSIQNGNKNQTISSSLIILFDKLLQISFIDSLNFCFLLVPEDVHLNMEKIIPMISIEALRLWIKLLSFGYQNIQHRLINNLKNNFYEMFPYLVRILNYCKNLKPFEPLSIDSAKSTFDFQFASCLLMLIKMYHELLDCVDDYANIYCLDLYDITMKWFSIIHNESLLPDFDCNMCILILVEFILKHIRFDNQFIHLTLKKLMGINEVFVRKLCHCCIKNSNANILRKEIQGRVRDSSNLPSYGSIYFKGFNSIPLFKHDSSICLLQSLIRIAFIANIQIGDNFTLNTFDHLFEYIDLVTNSIHENFSSNIFDLIEINIVAQTCLIIQKVISQDNFKKNVPNKYTSSIINFSLKINVLNNNQIKSEIIEKCLFYNFDENIKKTYENYSRFDHSHWIFDPLLTQVQINGKTTEPKNKIKLEELISSLSFIEQLNDNFNDHLCNMKITNNLLFEILCNVFLIDENYFFDENIRQILEKFLNKILRKSEIICSIEDNVPRLGNIVDIYNKFSNQFVNSSYYNQIFCNYLFVFFQPKCSSYFRNHFLSEYSYSIKMANFKIDDLLLPLNSLLDPIETDLKTLEIYLKTLLSEGFISPEKSVLYCFLIHHLNYALFRNESIIKRELFENDNINEEIKLKRLNFNKLIRSVEMSKNIMLKKNIKNYSHISKQNGLEFVVESAAKN